MKNIRFYTLLLAVLISTGLSAQVGINTDGSDPDGSAMLDVQSTDKGMLIPRMTTIQRTAVSTPAIRHFNDFSECCPLAIEKQTRD